MPNVSFCILIAVILSLTAETRAAEVRLAWDPNPETDIAGYNLWYSSGGAFTLVNAGTNTSVAISNLVEGVSYSFFATAYNTAGLESDPSETIQYLVPLPPPPDPVYPPVIIAQPASITVNVGAQVALTVQATGSDPLAYQWYRDGILMAGATASTLSFSSAQTTNTGSYYVIVSNPAGTVTSLTATLTVKTTKGPKGGGGGGGKNRVLTGTAVDELGISNLRVLVSGAGAVVGANGIPGVSYLLYAADHVSAAEWDLIATALAAEDGSVEFAAGDTLSRHARFFRVQPE